MQIAKIENGTVTQIGHYKTLFPDTSFPPSDPNAEFMQMNGCLPVVESISFNEQTHKLSPCEPYIKDNKVFIIEVVELTEQEIIERRRAQIPQVVSMRQAKLALLTANLLDTVDGAMKLADRKAQIEWEYAQEVNRDWPTLTLMQNTLNLTDEQIDQLFISASQL
jgi:hypothetical protein